MTSGCRGGPGRRRVDRAVLQQQPDERAGGYCRQRIKRTPAEFPEDERRHSGNRKVHGKDCDHCYLRKVRNSIIKSWSRRSFVGFGPDSLSRGHRQFFLRAAGGVASPVPGSVSVACSPRADSIGAMNSATAPEAMQPSSELEAGSHGLQQGARPGLGGVGLGVRRVQRGHDHLRLHRLPDVQGVRRRRPGLGGARRGAGHRGGGHCRAGARHGQRSDTGGRRKLWLGVNTAAVALLTALCFFVFPRPGVSAAGRFTDRAGQRVLRVRGRQLQRHAGADFHARGTSARSAASAGAWGTSAASWPC